MTSLKCHSRRTGQPPYENICLESQKGLPTYRREHEGGVRSRVVVNCFSAGRVSRTRTRTCWENLVVIVLTAAACILGQHGAEGASNSHRESLARDEGSRRTKPEFIDDSVQRYLMDFGYLPQSDLETGNLRSERQLHEAIGHLQKFARLKPTGKVDKATKNLLLKPRCGVPDFVYEDDSKRRRRRKRYALRGSKWDYTNLTWSLRAPPRTKPMDIWAVQKELKEALNVWAENSQLKFRMVNHEHADIIIEFSSRYHGDGFPFDGPGKILAHAFFPGTGRGGDAHFDDDEYWLVQNEKGKETEDGDTIGTSLFSVAAHEFGHSLGLSHSSVEGALMYPWYQGTQGTQDPDGKYKLPDDDRLGIEQLYGARDRPFTRPSKPMTTTPAPSTRPPYYPPHERPQPPERPHYPERPQPTERPHYPERPQYPERPPYPERPQYPERPHERPQPPKRPKDEKPDTCDTSYDAISLIRGELFIFKGRYFWRLNKDGLLEGYPVEISRFWYGLPKNFSHVDAVYERLDKKIVFFIGKQYYVLEANVLAYGYPKPLTYLGLPETLDKIDGAMVWGHNQKTYFFSGTMYWRLEEQTGKVELDYPRDMKMWGGVDYNIDCVFRYYDGVTYFFKGKGFWKFNDRRMRVENVVQTPSAQYWMQCPGEEVRLYSDSKSEVHPEISKALPCRTLNTWFFMFSVIGILYLRVL